MNDENQLINQSNYVLGICELFNENIHGFIPGQSSPIIYYHYFMRNDLDIEDFYQNITLIKNICKRFNKNYKNNISVNVNICLNHPIKNYQKIIQSMDYYHYIKPEIIKKVILSFGNECVAIIKTFWLKLIQRTWKKIYSQQREVLNKRKCLSSIQYREIKGTWPSSCSYYPTLKGMMSFLYKNS
jgi:hypothetical protein